MPRTPNSVLLTGASSLLRCASGAAKRGRWACKGRHMGQRIAVILMPLAIASCATATYSPLEVCSGPVTEVRILLSLPVEGTYKKCGSIRIEGGGLASDSTTLDAAKDSARRNGANAIVIVEQPDPKFTWAKSYSREGSAIAIRVFKP